PTSLKIRVSNVIAHEMAHQWFGDLVTMKWWDDLWLNESFATFMSYKATGNIHPEWDMEANFVLWETSGALKDDSLSITHPIEAHVENPAEIEHMFDNISYGKGASILRMIEAYVSPEGFRRGVINYLKEHSFSNAEGKDLWTSISKVTGEDINSIMEDWIRKPGHPIVYVNVEGNNVRLTQRRFSLLNNVENLIYKIPLTLEINGKAQSILFDKESMEIESNEEIKSLKVNLNRTGFYRVHYNNLNVVFNANLNNLEKWGIVNDYWDFLLAGIVSFDEYRSLVNKFQNENKDHLPIRSITSNISTLLSINPEKYKGFAKEFLVNQYKIWKNRSGEIDKLVYATILRTLVEADDSFALGLSNEFKYYDQIDPNEKDAVVEAYGIATGDFNTLYSKYKSYQFDEDKLRMLSGMEEIRDPSIVDKLFSLIFNNEIKKQDSVFVMIGLSYNPYVREELYSYMLANFSKIKDFVNNVWGGPWGLGRIIRSAMVYIGVDHPKEVIEFLEKIKYPEIERDVKIAIEYIQAYSKLK
ncbi:MAG: M1 family metallopeptidase, partial [Sulfolobaceae archaeon]|nr:M1 family metallopeptidase [Sulfolobaceae archaeon]